PTVIKQQLATAVAKGVEVGIDGIQKAVVSFIGKRDIVVIVEVAKVPLWVLEEHVLKIAQADHKGLRPSRPRFPSGFTARLEAGKDLPAGARIRGAGVNYAGGFHLGRGQTIGGVRTLAGKHAGIKVAACG